MYTENEGHRAPFTKLYVSPYKKTVKYHWHSQKNAAKIPHELFYEDR